MAKVNYVSAKSNKEYIKRQLAFWASLIGVSGIAVGAASVGLAVGVWWLLGVLCGAGVMLAWLWKEIARDHISDHLQDHLLKGLFTALIRRRL